MINLDEQINFFKLLGTKLESKIECIAIGGSAMMFYGAKLITKDIDLVFLKKDDIQSVKKALYDSGFDERINIKKIFREEEEIIKPILMDGKEVRFDLFLNEVIGFKIHDKSIERLREIHEFGNLIVKTACPEDILMMKGCTEREKDRDDAAELIKKFNINWDIIKNETLIQTKIGVAAFPLLLYDFLTELKDNYKVDVPKDILKHLIEVAEKIIKELKKKDSLVKVTKYKK